MNDWQKVENPVEGGVSGPDAETAPAALPPSPFPPAPAQKTPQRRGKETRPAVPGGGNGSSETAAFPFRRTPLLRKQRKRRP